MLDFSKKGFARKNRGSIRRQEEVSKKEVCKKGGIELHGGDRVAKLISSRKRIKTKNCMGNFRSDLLNLF